MDSVGKGAHISDATLLEEVLASRKELNTLNEELTHARERASQAVSQKERMAAALQEARDQVAALKEEATSSARHPRRMVSISRSTGTARSTFSRRGAR
jgi:chromosome segregation ATPase